MTTSLTVLDQEKLAHLTEEIRSIVSTTHESVTISMIAMKYMVGEAIVTNALYKKGAKTQGNLLEVVSDQVSIKVRTLADCVKLYETYPKEKPKEIADKLYTECGAWRNVVKMLYGEDPNADGNTEEKPDCSRTCPRHCPQ